jgi:DNA mismatch repair protein MutL
LNAYKKSDFFSAAQVFDVPLVLKLPVSEAEFLLTQLETFKSLGFDIEPFGSQTFKISSAPEFLKTQDIKQYIKEVLSDLLESRAPREVGDITHKTLSYLACRAAFKQGDYLSQEQRRDLIQKVEKLDAGYTCPHGRPVKIVLKMRDLGKMFHRIK